MRKFLGISRVTTNLPIVVPSTTDTTLEVHIDRIMKAPPTARVLAAMAWRFF